MPTRAGWTLVATAVVGLAAGRAFGLLELYVLGAAGLLLVGAAVALARRPCEVSVARRLHPRQVSVGTPARVDLHVTVGRRRAPVATLVDPVAGTVGARLAIGPLAAQADAVVGYRLPTRRRGPLRVGPLVVEVTDPFGLARRSRQVAPAATITILPAIQLGTTPPRTGTGGEPLAGAVARAAASSGALDVATLRPYVVGDDLRRVHWPATARLDDLVVRGAEELHRRRAVVILDCRRDALDAEAFEAAVSRAAGMVHEVAEANDLVRLVTTGGLDTGMVDARRQELLLLEHLALVAQHEDSGALPDELPAASAVLTGGPAPLELGALR